MFLTDELLSVVASWFLLNPLLYCVQSCDREKILSGVNLWHIITADHWALIWSRVLRYRRPTRSHLSPLFLSRWLFGAGIVWFLVLLIPVHGPGEHSQALELLLSCCSYCCGFAMTWFVSNVQRSEGNNPFFFGKTNQGSIVILESTATLAALLGCT